MQALLFSWKLTSQQITGPIVVLLHAAQQYQVWFLPASKWYEPEIDNHYIDTSKTSWSITKDNKYTIKELSHKRQADKISTHCLLSSYKLEKKMYPNLKMLSDYVLLMCRIHIGGIGLELRERERGVVYDITIYSFGETNHESNVLAMAHNKCFLFPRDKGKSMVLDTLIQRRRSLPTLNRTSS